jgi:hypothetical protein
VHHWFESRAGVEADSSRARVIDSIFRLKLDQTLPVYKTGYRVRGTGYGAFTDVVGDGVRGTGPLQKSRETQNASFLCLKYDFRGLESQRVDSSLSSR